MGFEEEDGGVGRGGGERQGEKGARVVGSSGESTILGNVAC